MGMTYIEWFKYKIDESKNETLDVDDDEKKLLLMY